MGGFFYIVLAFAFHLGLNAAKEWNFYTNPEKDATFKIGMDEEHRCKLIVVPQATDTKQSKDLQKLVDAIGNITSIASFVPKATHNLVRQINNLLNYQKEISIGEQQIGRSRGKLRDCEKACKEAIRRTCDVYNCKRLKDKFKRKCKQNCEAEFDC